MGCLGVDVRYTILDGTVRNCYRGPLYASA